LEMSEIEVFRAEVSADRVQSTRIEATSISLRGGALWKGQTVDPVYSSPIDPGLLGVSIVMPYHRRES